VRSMPIDSLNERRLPIVGTVEKTSDVNGR